MTTPSTQTVRVIDSAVNCPELSLVEGQGKAKVVLWTGNGAQFRSIQVFNLHAGDRLVPLQHKSDCVYYIVEGAGIIKNLANNEELSLIEGSIVHIDANDGYRIIAGEKGIRFLGGPCPPDEALYATLNQVESAAQ